MHNDVRYYVELEQLRKNLPAEGREQEEPQLQRKLVECTVGRSEDRGRGGTFNGTLLITFARYITPVSRVGETDALKSGCLV